MKRWYEIAQELVAGFFLLALGICALAGAYRFITGWAWVISWR